MGIDDLVNKAQDALKEHGDTISDGLEKAGEAIKDKTPDNIDPHVDTAIDKAQEYIEQQKNQ